MTKKLSIIIPVYNGERYLKECLDSLVCQLTSEVEVIIINDGSIDSSEEVIKQHYQNEINNKQIHYHQTINQGVSAARNLGMDLATGEYIGFVDCDDIAKPYYVESILDKLVFNPSIIEFGYANINEKSELISDDNYLHYKFGLNAIKNVINHAYGASVWYSHLRVVRQDVIGADRFPLGIAFCEDLIFWGRVYEKTVNVYSIHKVLYSYRINNSGATQNIKSEQSNPLIEYYQTLISEQSLHQSLLKINLAYVIRRLLKRTPNGFGSLPRFIQKDLYRILLKYPTISKYIKIRTLMFSVFGGKIAFVKEFFGKV